MHRSPAAVDAGSGESPATSLESRQGSPVSPPHDTLPAWPHTGSMLPTDEGSHAEEIVIPESLLAAASIKQVWNQASHERWNEQHIAPNPVEEISILKKRQSNPSWPATGLNPGDARRRQASYSPRALEEGRGIIYPVIEDQVMEESWHGPQSIHPLGTEDIEPETPGPSSTLGGQPPPTNETQGVGHASKFAPSPVRQSIRRVVKRARASSLGTLYNRATLVNIKHERRYWVQLVIEYGAYTLYAAFVYFVLVGMPLWKGAVYWLYWLMRHRFVFQGGWAIVICLVVFYSFSPLLTTFERDAPDTEFYQSRRISPTVHDTALLIPCFKAAAVIGETLEAAVKIFPPSHIYVIANGDSLTPLDNTEEICRPYGVNHIWSPVGSKIVALFVGSYATKHFRYVLLIDDDCILPPNFPVVISRLTDSVRCIGYTIKAVAADGSKGTYCQQAQDLEYKLAGLQRTLAGRIGSATFPHGAISLWERAFLRDTLQDHPGFSISEDWFLGNSCRRLGGRIQMCSSVFVETHAPPSFLFASGRSRGGFGEMTVFKQRFMRWNFFIVNGMRYNLAYILQSWKLGKWEIGAKIFVLQELYETILTIFAPFVLPISLIVRPGFCAVLLLATLALYLANAIIFNEVHLRRKQERVSWKIVLFYYMPYKIIIAFINVGSNYWSLFKYAKYFARRRPKLTEDHKAVGLVLKLEESAQSQAAGSTGLGRSMTVRSVGVRRTSSRMSSVHGSGTPRARWSYQSHIEEGSEYDVIEPYT
ncbi:glycosyl transferase [Aspergillus sclerotioniger CBS 115572]|uniref:Glycosyl transferase n=1 Tax=Aspergillus sclerotioniger CBS 115572 TaxID=1450535 RepID=A0A317UZV8_9EURO|nr:glycosyl transferase [Aspergillus sclerotioniger CBS 115572]PWY67593.1 glycosyl transferase [Aspergillus sclerotioniger CBS 115572]